jgi:hypothetical protein
MRSVVSRLARLERLNRLSTAAATFADSGSARGLK